MILKISVDKVVLSTFSFDEIDQIFNFISGAKGAYFTTYGVKLWDETRCRENQQTTADADSHGESTK